jgi:ABC-type nitrate/sulfonate/bicarbonate transport system ATPase subunit
MRGITKTFPGVKALSDVTLDVSRGEVHAICGENGAGKSTLMKVLSGVYPHGTYTGDIVFEDEIVEFKSISDSEAKGIVIIHQELALSPYLSIAENIFLNNEQRGAFGLIDWNKTNSEAAKLLARVGLRENPTTRIMDIGVGKQQLVEIAKALSKRVKLLILDEPISSCTSRARASRRSSSATSSTRSRKSPTRSRSSVTAGPLKPSPSSTSPKNASSKTWSVVTSSTATRITLPTLGKRSFGLRTGPLFTRKT